MMIRWFLILVLALQPAAWIATPQECTGPARGGSPASATQVSVGCCGENCRCTPDTCACVASPAPADEAPPRPETPTVPEGPRLAAALLPALVAILSIDEAAVADSAISAAAPAHRLVDRDVHAAICKRTT